MRTPATASSFCLALVAVLMTSCSKEEPEAMPPVPVVTGQSSSADVPVYREYPGKTMAVRTMPINARVEGILEKTLYKQGDLVTPGQVLYIIQPEEYQADRDAALADVAAAVAEQDYAHSQVDRNKSLVSQGAISREYFDELKSKLVTAQAHVKSAKAKLVQAELNLSYSSVSVPDVPPGNTYRIGATYFDEGALVGPGMDSELATVVQVAPIRAVFDPAGAEWPEYLEQIKSGQIPLSVEVTIPTDPDFRRTGNVNFIDNLVDPHTSTVEMWADIENNDFALMPGQFVSVKVLLRTLENAVVIPTTAVQTSSSKKFVWTLKDGKTPVQTTITVGPEFNDKIVISKGLKSGATLIFEGGSKLRPGVEVQVVSPDQMKQMNQPATGNPGTAAGNTTGS